MHTKAARRIWASLTLAGLILTQFTTGVFPIPIRPTDTTLAADCRDMTEYTSGRSGSRAEITAPCNGYVRVSLYADNGLAQIEKVEGGRQVIGVCDDEGYDDWCSSGDCCRIPGGGGISDNEALICDRDGNFLARVRAENGQYCPPDGTFAQRIAVRQGDQISVLQTFDGPASKIQFEAGQPDPGTGGGGDNQCSDGQDNDGDGYIDALVEESIGGGNFRKESAKEKYEKTWIATITCENARGDRRTFGTGNTYDIARLVQDAIEDRNLPFTKPTQPLVRSTGGSGGGNRWNDNGTPHMETLNATCAILGYPEYVSSTCLDNERSGKYPNGKCNFDSPHNNELFRFTGDIGIPACSDGQDNDGDGDVDYPEDEGCASARDTSEVEHDPLCRNPDDDDEAGECNDNVDNDGDGLIDEDDPRCSPNGTYDPNHEPESPADATDLSILVDERNDGQVYPGTELEYRLTVNNAGPLRAENIVAESDIPSQLSASDFNTQESDSDCRINGNRIVCEKDSLGSGSSSSFDIVFDIPESVTCSSEIVLQEVRVTSDTLETNLTNNRDGPERTSVVCTQCMDGIDNDGDGEVDYPNDPGCSSIDDDDENDSPYECDDGKDNDGDGYIDYKADGSGDPHCTDPEDDDESAPEADLQVTVDGPDSAYRFDTFVYTVHVRNRGPDTATNVRITNTLLHNNAIVNAQLDYEQTSDVCSLLNNAVYCELGELEDDESTQLTIAFTSLAAQQCGNEVIFYSIGELNETDPNVNNNSDTHNTDVLCSECSDATDNDGDGEVDYPNDPGCSSIDDDDENDSPYECDDGRDNDGDGYIDYKADGSGDPHCTDPEDDDESAPEVDLSIQKGEPHLDINANSDKAYRFDIRLTKPPISDATDAPIYFEDELPDGFTLNQARTDYFAGAGVCSQQGDTVTCGPYYSADFVGGSRTSVVDTTIVLDVVSEDACGDRQNTVRFTDATLNAFNDPDDSDNEDTVDFHINCGDLELEKEVATEYVEGVGDEITYTFHIENLGPDLGNRVSVYDLLPLELAQVLDDNDKRAIRLAGCHLTEAYNGSYEMLCGDFNLLAVNDPKEISFTVTIEDEDSDQVCGTPLVNNARVFHGFDSRGGRIVYDFHPNNNEDSAQTTLACREDESDLTVTKEKLGDQFFVSGQEGTYRITVHNNGPDAAQNILITDEFSSGLTPVYPLPSGCSITGTREISCEVSNLPNGDTVTLDLTFTARDLPLCSGDAEVRNIAFVEGDALDPNQSNNRTEIEHTLKALCTDPVISVGKTGPPQVNEDETLFYTITVQNSDQPQISAKEVLVRDAIPDGLTYNDALSSTECRRKLNDVVCDLGTVQYDTTEEVRIAFTPNACGITIENTATAGGDNFDTTTSETVTTQINCLEPDLDMTKTALTPNAVPGAEATFRVRVTNSGDGVAEDVIVKDIVPNGLEFVRSIPSAACDKLGGIVECDPTDIAAGDTLEYDLVFRVLPVNSCSPFVITNIADLNYESENIDWAYAQLSVLCDDTTLNITKTPRSALVQNETITYDFRIANVSASTAYNVLMEDTVPEGLEFRSATNASCSTHTQNNVEYVTCSWAYLPQSASFSFSLTFDVIGTCNLEVINRASAEADNADKVTVFTESDTIECPIEETEIQLIKEGPETVTVGEEFSYTFTLTNLTNVAAENVVLEDTLPAGIRFTGPAATHCHVDTLGVLRCPIGILSGNRSQTLTLNFIAEEQQLTCNQSIVNSAQLISSNADTATSEAVQTRAVCPQAQLSIEKTGPDEVTAGEDITYTFTVSNTGDGLAEDVMVLESFVRNGQPISPPFILKDIQGAICTDQNSPFFQFCSMGDIPAGQTRIMTITYEVPLYYGSLVCGQTITNRGVAYLLATPQSNAADWNEHDVYVECPPPQCSDGVDNDGDGLVDMDDPACDDPEDNDELLEQCTDPVSILDLSGLEEVIVYEQSGRVYTHTFSVGDERLRRDITQSLSNNDFVGVPDEYYDIFVSGPYGNLQINGGYITIQALREEDNLPNNRVGNNIDAVELVMSDGTRYYATVVSDVQTGTELTDPAYIESTGYAIRALGRPDGNSTRIGNDQTSITLGLCDAEPVEIRMLELHKEASKERYNVGEDITYTLTVRNTGNVDLSGIRLQDSVPSGLIFKPADSDGRCSLSTASIVECTGISVDAGDEEDVTITFAQNTALQCSEQVTNTATVYGAFGDGVPPVTAQESVERECGAPEIVMNKTGPSTVEVGQNATYTITVENTGTAPATAVQIIDEFLINGSAASVPVTFEGDSANICSTQGSDFYLYCNVGDIEAGGSRTFTVTFSLDEGDDTLCTLGTLTNRIRSNAAADTHNATVLCPESPLRLIKTANTSDPLQGEIVIYTLTVQNTGILPVRNVVVRDELPNDLTFLGSLSSNECTEGNGVVTCSGFSLTPQQTREFIVAARVSPVAQCNAPLTNYASASGDNALGAQTQETVTVSCPQASLRMLKDVDRSTVEQGQLLTYTLRIQNTSQSVTAKDVMVRDAIPAGLTFVPQASSSLCQSDGSVVSCGPLNVGPSAQRQLSLVFRVEQSVSCTEDIRNTAFLTATNAPDTTAVADAVEVFCASPDMLVRKTVDKNAISGSGQQEDIIYTIEVENTGNTPLTRVRVTDVIPAHLTFLPAQSSNACQQAGSAVLCNVQSIAVSDTATFRLAMRVNVPQVCGSTISNTAQVDTFELPLAITNPATTDVDACPDTELTIRKIAEEPQYTVGDLLKYSITVRNTGSREATNIIVADPVPTHLEYIDNLSDSKCDLSAGTVICDGFNLGVNQQTELELTFRVRPTAQCNSTIVNLADAYADNAPVVWSNQETVTVLCPQAELTLRKIANVDTAQHLDTVIYRLRVRNPSLTDATSVTISDTLPSTLQYIDSQSDPACDLEGGTVVCDGFNVNAGTTKDFSIAARVLPSATCDTTILNTARVVATNAAAVESTEVPVQISCPVEDFSITKTARTDTVYPGNPLVYDIEIENTGEVPLSGTWIIDTIPTGLTFNATASDSRCFKQGNTVKCGDTAIAAGNSDTYTIAFRVSEYAQCGTDIANTAYVVFLGNSNLDGYSNEQKTPIACFEPELQVTKEANEDAVYIGDTVTYTLTATNIGQGDATNVTVSDDIIPELTYVPNQSSPTCEERNGTVTCGPVDLDAGEQTGYLVTFVVNSSAQCDSTIYNQVLAEADNAESVLSNSENVGVLCRVPKADIAIKKTGVSQILRGTTIIYDIDVTNLGPDTAQQVRIYDTIPQVLRQNTSTYINLEFDPFQSDGSCIESAGEILCGGFDLVKDETKTVQVAFTVPANAFCAKPIVNRVEVESVTEDPITSNNHDRHYATVNCATGTLDIEKDGPETARKGDEITYSITVTNTFDFTVTQNRMIDPVPEGLQFIAADSNICDYSESTDEVICGEFDLDDGESRTFNLTFRVLETAECSRSIVNIADIWSEHGGINPQWSNPVVTEVACDATLTVEKSDNRETVLLGQQLTYDILVRNISTVDAEDVEVVDTLPDAVTFVSASAGGNYNASSHTVTWVLDVDRQDTETLTVTVDTDNARDGDELRNVVCLNNTICDNDTTTVIEQNPVFIIAKSDGRTRATANDTLTYVIDVTNISVIDAPDFTITDTLPPEVTFLDASDGGSYENGTVTWVKGIAPGETISLEVSVRVNANVQDETVLLNEACIANTVCDDDTTTIDIEQEPVLTIEKTDYRSTVERGETLIYSIFVRNISSVNAEDVEIIDTLPSYVTFVSASGSGSFSGGDITWVKDIPAGQTLQMEVAVSVNQNAPEGTYLLNFVEITGGPDADDTTRVVVTPEPVGCIDVKKETYDTNGNPLFPVSQFTFFLNGNQQTVQNNSNGDARFTNVPVGVHTVTETIPGGWEQLSVTPANGRVTVTESSVCSTVTFKNKQVVDVIDEPEFTISKTDNETEVEPGDRLTYEITVRNTSTVDATDVRVTDDLPNNVDFVSASNGGRRSGNDIVWDIDLDAGEEIELTLRVDVDDNADDGDRIDNEACVADRNGRNRECDDDRTTVVVDDDNDDNDDDDDGEVTISINDDPDPIDVCEEDELEYEIRLENDSNESKRVDVIAVLDRDTDYRSSSDGGRERSNNRVEWDNINIGSKNDKTIRLRVRVDEDMRDGDSVRLTVDTDDGDSDTEITRIRNRCNDDEDEDEEPPTTRDLTISKTADYSTAVPGTVVTYAITIQNPSRDVVRNVTLSDNYPTQYLTITEPGGGSGNGGTLNWNLGTLKAGSTTVVRYRARLREALPRGTTVRNTATVRGEGITRTATHTIVIPEPPQTGLGSFINSVAESDNYLSEPKKVAVRPQPRNSDTMLDAQAELIAENTSSTLPVIIWITTMATGLTLGGLFGKKFLF